MTTEASTAVTTLSDERVTGLGQLHALLQLMRYHAKLGTMRDVWLRVLGMESTPGSEIWARMADVTQLVREARAEIELLAQPLRGKVQNHFTAIERVFTFESWTHDASSDLGAVTDHALDLFELAHHTIMLRGALSPVSDQERAELRHAVSQAFAAVDKDDTIPVELRSVIRSLLTEIMNALDSYKVAGPAGVVRSAKIFTMTYAQHAEQLRQNKNASAVRGLEVAREKFEQMVAFATRNKEWISMGIKAGEIVAKLSAVYHGHGAIGTEGATLQLPTAPDEPI